MIALLLTVALAAAPASAPSFSGLSPLPVAHGTSLELPIRPAGRARLDFFERRMGNWALAETFAIPDDPHLDFEPLPSRRAVLIRFERSPIYYWEELPERAVRNLRLDPLKDVAVTVAAEKDVFSIFRDDRTTPQQARATGKVIPRFPAVASLVCRRRDTVVCVSLGRDADELTFPSQESSPPRVFRVLPSVGVRFVAKEPDKLGINPKLVPVSVISSGPWTAVTLGETKTTWTDVVVDVFSETTAVHRVDGAALPEVPGAHEVTLDTVRGVAVRAFIGDTRHALLDRSSLLLVFQSGASQISSRIPLASARPDDTGIFKLPALGEGDYSFKLLSAECTGDVKTASVRASVPADVVFDPGLTVSGRIRLSSGGSPSDPVTVEVVPDVTTAEGLGDPALAEKVRFAKADDDGRFRVALGRPGKYRVLARWGVAVGERRFEINESVSPLDLGEIALQSGAALHGSLAGCANGEVAVIPVPDFSRPFSTAVGSVRHANLQADGHFIVEGLQSGQWSVTARCGGSWVDLDPTVILVPPAGDVIAVFQRAKDAAR